MRPAQLVRASCDTLPRVGELTERVEAAIRGMIERGEYGTGDRLPSERELASQLSAGRTTVRLVLTKLAAQGLVEAQHGRGYFVTGPTAP
jgi:DNA-binding FadR family transcriptional regulator